MQEQPLGTGDAVRASRSVLEGRTENVLVLAGDAVLLDAEMLRDLVRTHRESGAAATVLGIEYDDARSYGRLVRRADGSLERIVEARDATPEERVLREANSSIYVFRSERLWPTLDRIEGHNAQGELYLTDAIGLLVGDGEQVAVHLAPEPFEAGVNTRAELAEAAAVLRDRINLRHMLAGVTIVDPQTAWIEPGVEIEPDAVIHPFVELRGRTRIETGAEIHANCVVVDAQVGSGATVGPFCYLRPETVLGGDSKAGTFVEIKNSPSDHGRRCRISRTSAMRTSARTRTSERARSPRTSPTSPAAPRVGRGSGGTSGPGSRMASSRPWKWVREHGSPPDRRSPRTCPPVRSRSHVHGRRTRRDMQLGSGTTELVLPGLDDAEHIAVSSEPQTGHWIERGPQKRLMVFAGRSHLELAEAIAEQLGVELGMIETAEFANGETYVRYDESIRGCDVFLVQTGCDPIDRNLMELFQMIQAAKLGSAKRITAVIPLFPYARQDRKAKPREPITARLVADILQVAGADRILTMDLHAGQIQGFFTIPVDHMTALPLFARHFRDLGLYGEGIVSVSPDTGRAKQAERFADMVESEFAIMHKTRPARDVARVTEIAGRVKGKRAIIGDDVIMTGRRCSRTSTPSGSTARPTSGSMQPTAPSAATSSSSSPSTRGSRASSSPTRSRSTR